MKLILVRGLPGSGKTTYAKSLGLSCHFEADQYFERNGFYQYNPTEIHKAHQYCQQLTEQAMREEADIVVSNTFTRVWEMEHYFELAKKFGYEVEVVRMAAQYGSIHNVPESVVEKMKQNYEPFPGEKVVR